MTHFPAVFPSPSTHLYGCVLLHTPDAEGEGDEAMLCLPRVRVEDQRLGLSVDGDGMQGVETATHEVIITLLHNSL